MFVAFDPCDRRNKRRSCCFCWLSDSGCMTSMARINESSCHCWHVLLFRMKLFCMLLLCVQPILMSLFLVLLFHVLLLCVQWWCFAYNSRCCHGKPWRWFRCTHCQQKMSTFDSYGVGSNVQIEAKMLVTANISEDPVQRIRHKRLDPRHSPKH